MSEEVKYNPLLDTKYYGVYKKSAAMRIKLIRPRVVKNGDRDSLEEGFCYLEIAPVKEFTNEAKSYKWETDKIGVKIGMPDLQEIGYALSRGSECNLFHEFNGITKGIQLKRTEGKSPYFLTVNQNNKGEKSSVSIPVSAPEAFAISKLIESAIPTILNW